MFTKFIVCLFTINEKMALAIYSLTPFYKITYPPWHELFLHQFYFHKQISFALDEYWLFVKAPVAWSLENEASAAR
jgi:hypothetical protein